VLDPVVPLVLRGALALLFGAAALHKLRDPAGFRDAFAAYRLVPGPLVVPFARALPLAEACVASALLVPGGARAGGLGGALLLVLYAGAIAVNLGRGRRDLDCGCLGPASRRPIGGALLVRNGVLAAASLACVLPSSARPLVWLDAVTVVLAVAAAAVLYVALERLLASAPGLAALRAETRAWTRA
jgi:hypothetical protein